VTVLYVSSTCELNMSFLLAIVLIAFSFLWQVLGVGEMPYMRVTFCCGGRGSRKNLKYLNCFGQLTILFFKWTGVVFKVTYLWLYAVGVGVEKYHFCSA